MARLQTTTTRPRARQRCRSRLRRRARTRTAVPVLLASRARPGPLEWPGRAGRVDLSVANNMKRAGMMNHATAPGSRPVRGWRSPFYFMGQLVGAGTRGEPRRWMGVRRLRVSGSAMGQRSRAGDRQRGFGRVSIAAGDSRAAWNGDGAGDGSRRSLKRVGGVSIAALIIVQPGSVIGSLGGRRRSLTRVGGVSAAAGDHRAGAGTPACPAGGRFSRLRPERRRPVRGAGVRRPLRRGHRRLHPPSRCRRRPSREGSR